MELDLGAERDVFGIPRWALREVQMFFACRRAPWSVATIIIPLSSSYRPDRNESILELWLSKWNRWFGQEGVKYRREVRAMGPQARGLRERHRQLVLDDLKHYRWSTWNEYQRPYRKH